MIATVMRVLRRLRSLVALSPAERDALERIEDLKADARALGAGTWPL